MNHMMHNIRQPLGQSYATAQNETQSAEQPLQTTSYVEKILVGLEHAPPSFKLREQIIGTGGANLQYIRNETGSVVTLRGRGSMFIDPILGLESPEPLHLYLEHTRFEGLNAAKQLVKNLVDTLQQELIQFMQLNPTTQSILPAQLPPPTLIPQPGITVQKPQHALLQQNVQGQHILTAQQPNIIQHQFIQPNGIPIQLQQGNVIIQQPPTANLSIPPPAAPLKAGQIVQFQQPPPPIIQQQPQTVQTAQGAGTPIVLNHPQYTQYQYIQQPIQTARSDGTIQGNQLTIHHVYQPHPQIQVQASAAQQTQAIEQFAQIRSGQHFQAPQQYITIQGSTAYMMPPPSITHQATQQLHPQLVTATPNIIIQQQAHPQLQQLATMQIPQAPITIQNLTQIPTPNGLVPTRESTVIKSEDIETPKEEEKAENEDTVDKQSEDKPDIDADEAEKAEGTSEQHKEALMVPVSMTVPPPTLNVPPPMVAPPQISCVQHFVGNTLITTSAAPQMHVATASHVIHNGQNYIVNPATWQNRPPPPLPQHQQLQPATHYQIAPTEFHTVSQSIPAINLSGPPPPIYSQSQQQQVPLTINHQQVQLQFPQQVLQQMHRPTSIEQNQVINTQITSHPPPQFNVIQAQQQPPTHIARPPPGIAQRSMQPPFSIASMQHSQQQASNIHHRNGHKRKSENENEGPAVFQPRLGMGQKDPVQQADLPRFPNMEFVSQPPTNGPGNSATIGQDDASNGQIKNAQYQSEIRNGEGRPLYPNGLPPRPPRFNCNNGLGFLGRQPGPPDGPGFIHRMSFNGQPPPGASTFRPEGMGNMNGGFNPRFRGQWHYT